jgi:3-phosphoglycerate kinase
MKKMKTIKDFNFKNKRVLVRCDFNVPFGEGGEIEDDFRITQTLPTLKLLKEKGANLILMSHLGDEGDLSVVWDKIDIEAEFLPNVRLSSGEEKNSDEFAKELASKADIYINDAFGVCHRNHASVSAITKYLPSGAGLLLEREVSALNKALNAPKKPLTAIIGGAKLESKAGVIANLLKIADYILVGGKIGKEESLKSLDKIVLPKDYNQGFDIGPKTIKIFKEIIKQSETIIWAGPMGMFEEKRYELGTKEVAKAIIQNKDAFKVVGGGDTLSALKKLDLREGFDHLSTGGGAMLAFLAGEELPGLKALGYYGN